MLPAPQTRRRARQCTWSIGGAPASADEASSGISEEPIIKLKYCIPRAGRRLTCMRYPLARSVIAPQEEAGGQPARACWATLRALACGVDLLSGCPGREYGKGLFGGGFRFGPRT